MTTITAALLRRIMPGAGDRAELYAPHLEAARSRWVGDKPEHVAMWLAQLAHESGELRYVREIASGNAYEGRADLGNTQPGDGPRFRGRGLIQLTGRDNYARAAAALGLPLLDHPELLEAPAHAAAVSGWFWHWARCGERMDAADDPVLAVTRRINGGTNGLERRRAYYAEALAAIAELHAAPIEESQPTIVRAPEPAPAPAPEPAREIDHAELVSSVWRALVAGRKLANSATWKRRQLAVEQLAALLTALVLGAKAVGYDLPLSSDDLLAIAGAVWVAVGLFSGWATVATTASVGLPTRDRGGTEQRAGPGEPPGL